MDIHKLKYIKMKKIFLLSMFAILGITSCITEDREIVDEAFGVYPEYTKGDNSVFNLLDATNSIVDYIVTKTESGGAKVASGEIFVNLNGGESFKLFDVTSFPFEVKASLENALSAMGLTTSDVTGGDLVNFSTYFITDSGQRMTSASIISASIVCPPITGTYTISMQDSYGDGWQGGHILASLDGVDTKISMCNQYDGSCAPGESTSSIVKTFEVPAGSAALVWSYVDDSYNSEVSFTITDPNGLVISTKSDPSGGVLSVPSTCP